MKWHANETARDRDYIAVHSVSDIVIKAHRRAYAILRAFGSRDIHLNLLMRAFLFYVPPIVEYNNNSIIWSPSMIRDIDSLELVQRRFTKPLHGLKNLSYYQRSKH